MSFKITIFIAFLFFIGTTSACIIINFYYNSVSSIVELSEKITEQFSQQIIEKTRNYLATPATQVIPLSRIVENPDNIMDEYQNLWRYMWEQLLVYEQIQTFFVADRNGNYVQVRRSPEYATRYIDRMQAEPLEQWFYRSLDYNITKSKKKTPKFDPRTRPWFQNTQAERNIYWTDVYVFTTAKTPGISASYPVTSKTGKDFAVVCVNLPLTSISKFIQSENITKNSVILVVTENTKELLAYSKSLETTKVTTLDDGSEKIELFKISDIKELSTKDAVNSYFQDEKVRNKNKFMSTTLREKYFVSVVPFPMDFASSWKMFVIIPETDLLQGVKQNIYNAVVISVLIIIISSIMVYLMSDTISRSFHNLSIVIGKIKNFELKAIPEHLQSSRIKEVNDMSNAISSTVNGLRAFEKYVPAALVRELIQNGNQISLGGFPKEIAIFFADIQGFTSLSEQLPPKDLTLYLSKYLDRLSGVIMQQQGTIDKYIGDAIMAFWGAPSRIENISYCACNAALCCQLVLKQLNTNWNEQGLPSISTRIGIHTGEAIVGNIGSDSRMNYTAIGDSVNLASRLEGANKVYGTKIIISEDTYRQVSNDFLCRPLDIIVVKGKTQGVKIYQLVSRLDDVSVSKKIKDFCKYFTMGFDFYLRKEWDAAIKVFSKLEQYFPEEKSLLLYLKRCRYFRAHPESLAALWNGVTTLVSK